MTQEKISEMVSEYLDKYYDPTIQSVGRKTVVWGYTVGFVKELINKTNDIHDVSQQSEQCEGKCGMSYCDDNGCIDRKRNLVEPKDKPEHCG